MVPRKGLDEASQQGDIVAMRTGRPLALIAILAAQGTGMLGASYASYPNPIGEKVYRPHLLLEMLPIAVIVSALLLGWLVHAVRRKVKTHPSDDAGSHCN